MAHPRRYGIKPCASDQRVALFVRRETNLMADKLQRLGQIEQGHNMANGWNSANEHTHARVLPDCHVVSKASP
ncbi:MAG: hypothetical protein M3022_14905 [Actinomycetota bacterium]|nr:hypothetical protein [Actinomycetota bacterium]